MTIWSYLLNKISNASETGHKTGHNHNVNAMVFIIVIIINKLSKRRRLMKTKVQLNLQEFPQKLRLLRVWRARQKIYRCRPLG